MINKDVEEDELIMRYIPSKRKSVDIYESVFIGLTHNVSEV